MHGGGGGGGGGVQTKKKFFSIERHARTQRRTPAPRGMASQLVSPGHLNKKSGKVTIDYGIYGVSKTNIYQSIFLPTLIKFKKENLLFVLNFFIGMEVTKLKICLVNFCSPVLTKF